ncbi:MAG: pyrroline-5-carboxylate reductase [Caulobacteraceae bacterium]|nr:pyrroline-5-carboxylate reductase [Caulobacteraceae bacterium]
MAPLALIGAGHMGGALLAGWRRAGVLEAGDLIVRDPYPGEAAREAAAAGAALNGPLADLGRARVVVFAVKPQAWREVAAEVAPHLATGIPLISIVAGVPAAALAGDFPGRPIVRAMPTTAAAVLKGAASLWSDDPAALTAARDLFEPLGAVAVLEREELIHAATAAPGSAPAYAYLLVEALEAAALAQGLAPAAARDLSRAALTGAAALMEATGADAAQLRRQVTSPGGTTQAALEVLMAQDGLPGLMARAVAAAADRSRALAAS